MEKFEESMQDYICGRPERIVNAQFEIPYNGFRGGSCLDFVVVDFADQTIFVVEISVASTVKRLVARRIFPRPRPMLFVSKGSFGIGGRSNRSAVRSHHSACDRWTQRCDQHPVALPTVQFCEDGRYCSSIKHLRIVVLILLTNACTGAADPVGLRLSIVSGDRVMLNVSRTTMGRNRQCIHRHSVQSRMLPTANCPTLRSLLPRQPGRLRPGVAGRWGGLGGRC